MSELSLVDVPVSEATGARLAQHRAWKEVRNRLSLAAEVQENKQIAALLKEREIMSAKLVNENAKIEKEILHLMRVKAERLKLRRDLSEEGDPKVHKVIQVVASYYGLKPRDIVSERRDLRVIGPRQVAMYICRKKTLLSFPQIGRAMRRDHTTIMHGAEAVERRIKKDIHLKTEINEIVFSIDGQEKREAINEA